MGKIHKLANSLWHKWKFIAEKIGNFNARVLLTVFYFLFITPFTLMIKLFSDPLKMKSYNTLWTDKSDEEQTLETAKKQ